MGDSSKRKKFKSSPRSSQRHMQEAQRIEVSSSSPSSPGTDMNADAALLNIEGGEHAIKSVQIKSSVDLSNKSPTPSPASTKIMSSPSPSSPSRGILLDLILSKHYIRAQDFLSDPTISNKEKKLNVQYQDTTDNELHQGHTTLVRAVLKQSTPFALLKLMVQYGGIKTLRIPNASQWTVLHWAAYSHHISLDVFKLILQKCDLAMIKGRNNFGNTPLEILLQKKQSNIKFSGDAGNNSQHQEVMKGVMDKIHALITKEQRLVLQLRRLRKLNTRVSRSTNNHSNNSSIYQTITWARQLSESEQNNIVLKHDGFKNMLNSIFIARGYLVVSMMDLYLQLGIVAVYSFFLRFALNPSAATGVPIFFADLLPSLIILATGFVWFFFRKTAQLLSSQLKMFVLEPSNVLDMIQFVLLVGSISIILGMMNVLNGGGSTGGSSLDLSVLDRIVFTAATCASWLKLLFVVGNLYYSIAVFIIAVIAIIGKIIPFLFTSVILLLMLAHMYLMWSVGNPNSCKLEESSLSISDENQWTCDLFPTYKHTFATLFHLESQIQSYHSVISYMNGFMIGLLMLNVLIAIVTNYFMVALEKGDQSFWRNRMQFVVECQCLFGVFSCMGLCPNDLVYEIGSQSSTSGVIHNNNDGNAGVLDDYDNAHGNDELYPMVTVNDSNELSDDNNGKRKANISVNDGNQDDLISVLTDSSRAEKVLLQRIRFGSQQNWDIHKRKMGKEEKRFFRWWFDQTEGAGNISTPSLIVRLTYFFKYAAMEEIMFPGKEYESILMGLQSNKHGGGMKLFLARLASYIQSLVNILLVACMFILGIVTFGLLWHRKMKEHLFCVKEMEMNDHHLDKADEMKQELLENLEDYETNQEKKLNKIFKKQEENGKKQYTKIAKQQKEFTKKQKDEFDKIDKFLGEIKSLLNEIGNRDKE